jgi:hypothetical protein
MWHCEISDCVLSPQAYLHYKKTLFSLKVLEAKMVEREDALESLPLSRFLA